MAIACAAMVILCAAVSIGSFDRAENTTMRAMFDQFDGDTFVENGITYIKRNNPKTYSSIDELVEKENLDINFPSILPDGVKIENVLYNDANCIIIDFNDDALQMEICPDTDVPYSVLEKNSKNLKFGDIDTYIIKISDMYTSYTMVDNYMYVIVSDTEEKIETIINGMIGDKK